MLNNFKIFLTKKIFAPSRIFNLFITFFVNTFPDIAFTFFDHSFNSFLSEVIFFSLLSKFVVFTKLAIWLSLAKFAFFTLEVKVSDVNLLNSRVAIYLTRSWSVVILF